MPAQKRAFFISEAQPGKYPSPGPPVKGKHATQGAGLIRPLLSAQRLLRKARSIIAGTISRPVPPIKPEAEQAGSGGSRGRLGSMRRTASLQTLPAQPATLLRRAKQSPSAIKDGKTPSFMQLCLFSSLFLSLADRVGRERGKDGEGGTGERKITTRSGN